MPRGSTPPRHEDRQAEDGFLAPPPIARLLGDALLRAWDLAKAARGSARPAGEPDARPAVHPPSPPASAPPRGRPTGTIRPFTSVGPS